MTCLKHVAMVAALSLVPATAVTAAPIFADDFESITPPARPSSPNWAKATSGVTSSNTGTPFGSQTTYVNFVGGGQELFSINLTDLPDVTTISFDFIDLSTDSPRVRVGWAQSGGDLNQNAVASVSLQSGTITNGSVGSVTGDDLTYAQNTAHSFRMIFNASTTDTLENYFGNLDLAPRTAHLYLNEQMVGTVTAHADRTPGRIGFRTFSNDSGTNIQIDNVMIEGGAVVPEPAALSLLGLGGLGLLRRRRA